MPKSETSSKCAASAAGRVLKDPKGSGSDVKSRAASALTQKPAKVSAGSERVIKGVSREHRDALKRLVDR
jgi:hypothetical protein